MAKARKVKAEPKTLDALLKEADEQWSHDKPSGVYLFTLGRFQHGWTFSVTQNWHRWMSAGLAHDFGPHPTPEEAVQDFLAYVKERRISVAGLQD